jgi:hypothetical protein
MRRTAVTTKRSYSMWAHSCTASTYTAETEIAVTWKRAVELQQPSTPTMTHYWPNFASLSDIDEMMTSYGLRDLSYWQWYWYWCTSSGIMPCRLVNSHTSEGLGTSIFRVVQKEAIFFVAYADAEGKLLGFSNCTRIYTASCPRRLEILFILFLCYFRDNDQSTSQFTSL